MTRLGIVDAISALHPTAQFTTNNGKIGEWHSPEITQPTEEEIVQKVAELEYQEEINEYQRQRAAEYPSYADQFDQIFHDGIDAWKATILEVKRRYPKQVMQPEVLEERKRQALADLEASREE